MASRVGGQARGTVGRRATRTPRKESVSLRPANRMRPVAIMLAGLGTEAGLRRSGCPTGTIYRQDSPADGNTQHTAQQAAADTGSKVAKFLSSFSVACLQAVADGVFYAELNELLMRELGGEGYSGVEVCSAQAAAFALEKAEAHGADVGTAVSW